MGFIQPLLNITGGVVFLLAVLALPGLLIQGRSTVAIILAVIGVIGLLYAVYKRDQLSTVQ